MTESCNCRLGLASADVAEGEEAGVGEGGAGLAGVGEGGAGLVGVGEGGARLAAINPAPQPGQATQSAATSRAQVGQNAIICWRRSL